MKKLNFYLFSFLSLLFLIPAPGLAQIATEVKDSPISQFKNTHDNTSEKEKINKPEIEKLAHQTGIDYQSAETLINLKNPFVSQLPRDTITPKTTEMTPQPVNTEMPQITVPQFNVTGMVWNTKHPQAIIDGHIVKIGDQVSNWVISEITAQGIHISQENQNYWILPITNPVAKTQNKSH